ncbi:alpha/beta-hydrolase [Artomyces pyxidatus]|uniref:Alpha/beta-hydrolase n=1 Tax=Artomyces pyxidatus TaxID=48021 RepID=A0ACB8SVH7_9AGAM|nr:alpha/beta-hydrolase [Artomyces pyxidatus]
MDPSAYKKLTTSRGFTYNYYNKAAEGSKPTLIFLHGFPSSSYDWRHQVAFFQPLGYGLIVPDMLGYAGTDKPTDPHAYIGSGLSADLVDILDAEHVNKVIVVGHDMGSLVASRFVDYHPDRIAALAFLAAAYIPAHTPEDSFALVKLVHEMAGREVFGYQLFMTSEGADKVIAEHFDSAFSLFFPSMPALWVEHMGPMGACEAWIRADKRSPAPAYITEEDKEHYRKVLLAGGFTAPLACYRAMGLVDPKPVPEEAAVINQPVFFAACKKDEICLPAIRHLTMGKRVKGPATIQEFDADHWVYLSHVEEINNALSGWLQGLKV